MAKFLLTIRDMEQQKEVSLTFDDASQLVHLSEQLRRITKAIGLVNG